MSPRAKKAIAAVGGAFAIAAGALHFGNKVDCSPEARAQRVIDLGEVYVHCGDDRECTSDVETEFMDQEKACGR